MTPPKEHNNPPVTNIKDMEICDLPNKAFKIAFLKRNFNKLQENAEGQFNKISNIIHNTKRLKFNKEIKTIKNQQKFWS